MKLHELAEAFDQLEATRSRLALVERVAVILRRATAAERTPIVYLLQARLRPPYEQTEVAVGEKLLAQAVAQAYHVSHAQVAQRFARSGDLGLVAAELAAARPASRLTVHQAYESLLAIAHVSGAGSVERKTSLLASLLRSAGPAGAKLVARVAQGRLRLGVGDQTILEAAALAALGERSKKPLLEHAYNVRSDLGSVVDLAFTRGAAGLRDVGPEVGIPVRPALAQRLPSAEAIITRLGKVQAEPKYDGFRLQIHRRGPRVWAFSRRLEDVTSMFPELVAAARRQLAPRSAILEGEAVVYSPETGEFLPFQITMTRKRKTRIAEAAERTPVRLFAFDLLYAGRRNYLPVAQAKRTHALRAALRASVDAPIAVTEARVIARPRELQTYFDEMIERGLEGIVAKRLDAPYQAGARGYAWVKLKRAYQSALRDTVDVVLVGYLRGRGKRAALGIGSLLGAVYDPEHDRFRTVAKIGSGLSDSAWTSLRTLLDAHAVREKPVNVDALITPDVWVEPAIVVEVLADEITRSPFHTCGRHDDEPGYALRFPRVVNGPRSDKAPTDATTEREILTMYRQQRRTPTDATPRARGKTARAKAARAAR
jgi:DNA ligase-1